MTSTITAPSFPVPSPNEGVIERLSALYFSDCAKWDADTGPLAYMMKRNKALLVAARPSALSSPSPSASRPASASSGPSLARLSRGAQDVLARLRATLGNVASLPPGKPPEQKPGPTAATTHKPALARPAPAAKKPAVYVATYRQFMLMSLAERREWMASGGKQDAKAAQEYPMLSRAAFDRLPHPKRSEFLARGGHLYDG